MNFYDSGKKVKDEYTGRDDLVFGKSKAISADKKAELDHVISTKEIHNDRARVLAELSTAELADIHK